MTRTLLCKIWPAVNVGKIVNSNLTAEKATFMLDYSSDEYFVILYYFNTEKLKYNFF